MSCLFLLLFAAARSKLTHLQHEYTILHYSMQPLSNENKVAERKIGQYLHFRAPQGRMNDNVTRIAKETNARGKRCRLSMTGEGSGW